jgi:uncharacterized protein with PIN domain
LDIAIRKRGGEIVEKKAYCPKCGGEMEARKSKITRKKSPEQEIQDTVYVCPECKGAFIPESIFGVH